MMDKKTMWTVSILFIVILFIGGILGTLVEARRSIIHLDEIIAERGEVYAGECFDQRNDLRRILRDTKNDLAVYANLCEFKLSGMEGMEADLAICQHDLDNLRGIILECNTTPE